MPHPHYFCHISLMLLSTAAPDAPVLPVPAAAASPAAAVGATPAAPPLAG